MMIRSLTIGIALLAVAEASAQVIFFEDFENPAITSSVTLTGAPAPGSIPNWTVVERGNGSGSVTTGARMNHVYSSPHVPDGGSGTSRSIQNEYENFYLSRDTTHNWSASDQFSVNLNATEQSWNSANTRVLRIRIMETVSGNLLYQDDWVLPEYDAAHDKGDDWSLLQTNTFSFSASDFDGTIFGTTTGTAGSALTFEIGQTSTDLVDGSTYAGTGRGLFFDNVDFSIVPEPSSFALLSGIFGLTWVMLRRRA